VKIIVENTRRVAKNISFEVSSVDEMIKKDVDNTFFYRKTLEGYIPSLL
jgi:hypothetical protein